jgi:hypothetical protein
MYWLERKSQNIKFPAYLRTAGIDEEGRVFASAALTGNERDTVLRAAWDGVPAVIHDDHVFLPTSWLVRDCPQIALPCEKIEARVRAAFAAQGLTTNKV